MKILEGIGLVFIGFVVGFAGTELVHQHKYSGYSPPFTMEESQITSFLEVIHDYFLEELIKKEESEKSTLAVLGKTSMLLDNCLVALEAYTEGDALLESLLDFPSEWPIPVTDGTKWTGVFLMPPELDGVELGLKDDGTAVWRIPKEGKFWKKEK